MNFKNQKATRTKLIATMGPTFEETSIVKDMLMGGVNVVRLNTSHGNYEEHGARIATVKKLREELNIPVSILLDTKGPEIRLHKFEGKSVPVVEGTELIIHTKEEILGNEKEFSVSYTKLAETVEPGQVILCDDGKLTLEVIEIQEGGKVKVVAKNTHKLSNNKAANVPGAVLDLPFIGERDAGFIKWGIEQGIDYVAASFVNTKNDMIELRNLLDSNGGKAVQIMPKIESLFAVGNLNEIFAMSDAVMIARGDLGVEIPYQEVPFYQKLIINKARAFGLPVVTATQMLDSMVDNPRATRAEITDVTYAVETGSDATMLSGESASGDFPREAVEVMKTVHAESEKHFNHRTAFEQAYAYVPSTNAETAYKIAEISLNDESIRAVFAFTDQGRLVKALSTMRTKAHIVGMTSNEDILYSFGANYNVYMHKANMSKFSDDAAIKEYAAEMGIKGKVIVANKTEFRVVKLYR